jgi:chloride channel 3/4/5
LKRLREQDSWIANLFDASQAWLIVAFVGVATGVIAVFIAIVEEWLSDSKLGYCRSDFYLNRKFCCWGQAEHECDSWAMWGPTLTQAPSKRHQSSTSDDEPTSAFFASYLIYVLLAVRIEIVTHLPIGRLKDTKMEAFL